MLSEKARDGLTEQGHWFRFWMPYVLQQIDVPGGKYIYLPLNRNYKPLGVVHNKHVAYEDYAGQAVRFSTDPGKFKDIWWQPSWATAADTDRFWLYNDGLASRADYFARFERLMGRAMPLHGLPKGERNLHYDADRAR